MRAQITILSCMLGLVASVGLAQVQPGQRRYQLHINQGAQVVSICTLCNTPNRQFIHEMHLQEAMKLTLHEGDEIEIWIDDPNPLLFTYKFGGIESTKNPDQAAAEDFAKSLSSFVSGFDTAVAKRQAAEVSGALAVQGTPLNDTDKKKVEQALAITKSVTRASAQADVLLDADAALIQADPAELRALGMTDEQIDAARASVTTYELWRQLAAQGLPSDKIAKIVTAYKELPKDTVTAKLRDVGVPEDFFNLLAGVLGELETRHKAIPELAIDSVQTSKWDNIRKVVEKWDVDSLATRVRDTYKQLHDADAKLDILSTGPEVLVISRALRDENSVMEMLKHVEGFRKNIGLLGKPLPITVASGSDIVVIDYDTLTDRRYSVIIDTAPMPEDYRAKAVTSIADNHVAKGTFRFVDTPFHNVHLTAGPALVYSLVRKPEFFADKAGEDLVIRKKPEEKVSGAQLGMMLNITPRAWDDPFFGAGFEMGISTGGDNFAACFGGGINFKHAFSVGVGAIVEKVDRLAGTLSVGQAITTAADLKTDKHYKAGAYFHITMRLANVGK
jgi:hypothetical protein